MTTDNRNLAERVLDLLECLTGFCATGASNGDLATAINASPPNVSRGMSVLIRKGWARKDEVTGRFFPTPAFTRLAFRVMADFDRMVQHLEDQRLNATGTPDLRAMHRHLTGV
jgi:DNA-binding IclR family transcriptional regulator